MNRTHLAHEAPIISERGDAMDDAVLNAAIAESLLSSLHVAVALAELLLKRLAA